MNRCFFLLILIFFSCCKSIKCNEVIACNYYKEMYKRIEKNYEDIKKNNSTTYYSSDYEIIYKLTGVQCDHIIEYDISYYPSKSNLKDWRAWYKKNKHRLYWDYASQTLKTK